MTCNRWEEEGLLYSSNELNDDEKCSYEAHLKECPECAGEWKAYQAERNHFFSIDILGEVPSAACDAEILRVCSAGPRRTINLNMVSLFLKKSAISFSLFFLGFIVVGYITLRTDVVPQNTTAKIDYKDNSDVRSSMSMTKNTTTVSYDTGADSTQNDHVNFANQRGNMDLKGVYQVDLPNNK